MRPTTTAAIVLGLCVATGFTNASEVGPDDFDTLTEWKVPFTDANPFQIAVAVPTSFTSETTPNSISAAWKSTVEDSRNGHSLTR